LILVAEKLANAGSQEFLLFEVHEGFERARLRRAEVAP
jgi:hypothetical protein